jgi:hypothetical protein
MTRRTFVTGVAAALTFALTFALTWALAPAAARAQERESEQETFVRRIYQREILRDVRGAKISDAEFYGLFTSDVRRLVQSPIPPQPNVAIGRLLHAFYGPGVLPGWEVTLQKVAPAQGTSVAVDIEVRGVPRHILVHTAREGGEWRIANIDYGGGEDYVGYHRKLRGQ